MDTGRGASEREIETASLASSDEFCRLDKPKLATASGDDSPTARSAATAATAATDDEKRNEGCCERDATPQLNSRQDASAAREQRSSSAHSDASDFVFASLSDFVCVEAAARCGGPSGGSSGDVELSAQSAASQQPRTADTCFARAKHQRQAHDAAANSAQAPNCDRQASSANQANAGPKDQRQPPTQVALVIGASCAVGERIARTFAALNFALVLADSRAKQSPLQAVASAICGDQPSTPIVCVSTASFAPQLERCAHCNCRAQHDDDDDSQDAHSISESGAQTLVARALRCFGRLDTVVICATPLALATKFDEQNCVSVYHRLLAANVHSVLYVCLAAFGALKPTRGSIVIVASECDATANTHSKQQRHKFGYVISKSALALLTKCLAGDFAPHVRVNCVSLAPIASSIVDELALSTDGASGAPDTEQVQCLRSVQQALANNKLWRASVDSASNEAAKMVAYLSSKSSGSSISGSRVVLGTRQFKA